MGSRLNFSFSATVYAVLALEWIQTILLTVDAFESFVYNYGDPAALTSTKRPGWFSLTVLCGLVSVPVQWYFSWRIYRLFKTIWLCSIICFVRARPRIGLLEVLITHTCSFLLLRWSSA